MTPTNRTIQRLEEQGWIVGEVERHVARISFDLFGFADICAFNSSEVLLIQATSGPNTQARLKKVLSERRAYGWLCDPSRRIQIWGWRFLKRTDQWEPIIIEVDREMFR